MYVAKIPSKGTGLLFLPLCQHRILSRARVGVKPTRAYLLRLQVHAPVSCIVASMRPSLALPCLKCDSEAGRNAHRPRIYIV
ncbi:MAG: hypothetical protein ACYT04_85685, partial [Nostoc sp.]